MDRVGRILARIEESSEPDNMNLSGFRLHVLKGDLAGFSGNWRVIFRFEGGHANDVDIIDDH